MRYFTFAAGIVTGLVLAYHHDKLPYRGWAKRPPATLPTNVVRLNHPTQARRSYGN